MLTKYKFSKREKVDVSTSALEVFGASSWATDVAAQPQQTVVHLASISSNSVYVRVIAVGSGAEASSTDYDYILDSNHRTADILVPKDCCLSIIASGASSTVAAIEYIEIT